MTVDITPDETPAQTDAPEPPEPTPTEETTPTPELTLPKATLVPVPPKALGVYCDRALTQLCSEVDFGSTNQAVVFLASNIEKVLDVTTSTNNADLIVDPPTMQVSAQATQVRLLGGCGEMLVMFMVAEPSQTEQLTVLASPCVD